MQNDFVAKALKRKAEDMKKRKHKELRGERYTKVLN